MPFPSRGKNDQGSVPKLNQFLEMALPFKPVNLGDAIHGGALRPCRDMHPSSHWNRDMTPDFRAVIDVKLVEGCVQQRAGCLGLVRGGGGGCG